MLSASQDQRYINYNDESFIGAVTLCQCCYEDVISREGWLVGKKLTQELSSVKVDYRRVTAPYNKGFTLPYNGSMAKSKIIAHNFCNKYRNFL